MKTVCWLLLGCLLSLLIASTLHAQWVQTNVPYTGFIPCFAVSPNGTGGTNLFAGTSGGGVFLSTNNGSSWTAVNNGLTNTYVWALAISGTNLFAGTSGGGVFLSTNNGTSWTAVDSGLTNADVLSLAVSPNGAGGTNLFAGTGMLYLYYGEGVFLSTNSGANWVNTGLMYPYVVTALAVSPDSGTGATNLFAGTCWFDGSVWYDYVLLSADNGTSWTDVSTGLTTTFVYAFAVSPNGSGGMNLFAGTSGDGVFLSTNNGTIWTSVDTGLTNTDVRALVVSGTNLFAGTYGGGVYLSTNNGASWTAVNTGLANSNVFALALSPDGEGGTNLFAGTDGGVWRRPLSEMITSVHLSSSDLPTRFSLEQNYPNPFNPSTKIGFAIPGSGFVSLKIFNLLGQEIVSLVNEEMKPGRYEVTWDARGYSSGVYFYRITAGSFVETKKLVLLK